MASKKEGDAPKEDVTPKKPDDGAASAASPPERSVGVGGSVQAQAGTFLYAPQELPKEFYTNQIYQNPSAVEFSTGGRLQLTMPLGHNDATLSFGGGASVLGGVAPDGQTSELLRANAHAEIRDVSFMHSTRLYAFGETGNVLGDDHHATGGGLEFTSGNIHLGSSATMHVETGVRMEQSSSSFFPRDGNRFGLLHSETSTDQAHLELHAGTQDVDFSVGGVAAVQAGTNTIRSRGAYGFSGTNAAGETISYNVEKPEDIAGIPPELRHFSTPELEEGIRNGRILNRPHASLIGTPQLSLGADVNVTPSTHISSRFYFSPMEVDPLEVASNPGRVDWYNHPGSEKKELSHGAGDFDSRFLLDVTQKISPAVQGSASFMISETSYSATVGAKYENSRVIVAGEAGVVGQREAPYATTSTPVSQPENASPQQTVKPVARAALTVKF